MKCFETKPCGAADRANCYVWNALDGNPDSLDNVKCWALKGMYQRENRDQFEECIRCAYYLRMNRLSGITAESDDGVAIIRCEGALNNARNEALQSVWADLRAGGMVRVILDGARVNAIYSCALGTIIRIHLETQRAGGMAIIVCPASGYLRAMFGAVRMAPMLRLAESIRAARERFVGATTPVRAGDLPERRRAPRPPSRYEYFTTRAPDAQAPCASGMKKPISTRRPCWLIEGFIEGVSFQYINDDCERCPYYREYGPEVSASDHRPL
jgi:anti-anti-sigma regulatory factor